VLRPLLRRPNRLSGRRPDLPLALFLGIVALWYAALSLLGRAPDPVERSLELRAARAMEKAIAAVREEALARGIEIDPAQDPARTGLVGLPFSGLTTTLGSLPAKRTGAQPDAAALLARLLREAGAREGDLVAIDSSGSFPGFAVAAIVAAESAGIRPVVVVSIGASTYGANRPELSIADMLEALARRGAIRSGPVAVSPGGGDDAGEGMDQDELEAALARAASAGVRLLKPAGPSRDVAERLSVLRESSGGRRPAAFVSIGGNWAAEAMERAYRAEGVPVLRILDIKDLCARTGLAFDPQPWPEPGSAALYARRPPGAALALAGIVVAFVAAAAAKTARRKSS